MTKEEKFTKGIIVEQLDNDYVCELYEGSTKHCDAVFFYSDWNDKTELFPDEYQVFQWLLWIASKMILPSHAKQLTEYALAHWSNWK